MTHVGKILVLVIMAFSLVFLGTSTVVFVTSKNWKTATEQQKQEVQKIKKKMDDALPAKYFTRVHKSYIVSINKIDSIERSRIFIGDKIIPVGDTYRDEFFKIIDGKNV